MGQWVSTYDDMGQVLMDHFHGLFTKEVCTPLQWPTSIHNAIPDALHSQLQLLLTDEEINTVVHAMAP